MLTSSCEFFIGWQSSPDNRIIWSCHIPVKVPPPLGWSKVLNMLSRALVDLDPAWFAHPSNLTWPPLHPSLCSSSEARSFSSLWIFIRLSLRPHEAQPWDFSLALSSGENSSLTSQVQVGGLFQMSLDTSAFLLVIRHFWDYLFIMRLYP